MSKMLIEYDVRLVEKQDKYIKGFGVVVNDRTIYHDTIWATSVDKAETLAIIHLLLNGYVENKKHKYYFITKALGVIKCLQ